MKRLQIILIGAMSVLFQTGILRAHPPDKIVLEFNAETSILKVVISHEVKDRAEHFTKTIEVKLNGDEILKQTFLTQQGLKQQTAVYQIHDAQSGDRLEVTAHCNIFGKKKETFQIP